MSKTEYSCTQDTFAYAMDKLMFDLLEDVDNSMMPAVRKACRVGRDETAKNAAANGWGETNSKTRAPYADGFKYTLSKRKLESVGEIGHKELPGLVHLLEKGHAKMGGGRVAGREHMAPAATVAFEVFEKEVSKAVSNAL